MIKKKALVTGCAGFIGSNLCKKLLAEGFSVIGIDNLSTSTGQNLIEFKDNANFKFHQNDICSFVTAEQADIVFNLACPASPPAYTRLALETLAACSIGVLNLLNYAKRSGAKFIQASTSEVYGEPKVHPQVESYFGNVNPIGPRSQYDEGKRFAESLITNFCRINNVDYAIVRIFNTYGPGLSLDDGRVVLNFIKSALAGQPLEIYGSGLQTRSFCYVDDTVDGLLRSAKINTQNIGPINIGRPEEITIKALAKMVIKLTKSSSKINFKPLPIDDPSQRQPDVTLAKKLLGWESTTDLETGLIQTINAFKQNNTLQSL